jgi:biopolymer transport protein ExbB
MNNFIQETIHMWQNGGWVLGSLALLALITYSTAAHLLVYLRRRSVEKVSDRQLIRWVADPDQAPVPVRELIRYTQDEVRSRQDIEGRFREVEAATVSEIDRRVAFVNVLVVAAPLFGLLGTVLGMLLTFKAIGIGGSSTSEVIARGISEALVATQTGMMVAIPGLILAFIAKRWRNEYVALLARLEGVTLRHYRLQAQPRTQPADEASQSAQADVPVRALLEPQPV